MNREEWNFGRLLEISGGYWSACALHAGVKLDVFTAIGSEAVHIDDLAEKLSADKRGLSALVHSLAAMKLLKKSGDIYSNTSAAAEHLSTESPGYLGHIILHHHHLMESWARLDQAVRSGRPLRMRPSRADPVQRESFLMGMFDIAMNLAPRIVPKLKLEGRRHLLDLGGGPGTYAIQMCRHNPGLKATVYDLPTTKPFAEKTIERFGLSDSIGFVAGDYIEEEIPGTYDAAWLSHILHAEGPDTCRRIVDKAVAALEPGGIIMIHEFVLNDSKDSPLFSALFSLNMLVATSSGRSYSEGEIRSMLAAAGVKDIERIPLSLPNDSGVIVGIV
jgi:precorrin-6B methylase 2